MIEVLVWRLVSPFGRTGLTVGATKELPDGGVVWFRIRSDGKGDRYSREPVVAEVREKVRAKELTGQLTTLYTGEMKWVMVVPPTVILATEPPLGVLAVLGGVRLKEWAVATAARAPTD